MDGPLPLLLFGFSILVFVIYNPILLQVTLQLKSGLPLPIFHGGKTTSNTFKAISSMFDIF